MLDLVRPDPELALQVLLVRHHVADFVTRLAGLIRDALDPLELVDPIAQEGVVLHLDFPARQRLVAAVELVEGSFVGAGQILKTRVRVALEGPELLLLLEVPGELAAGATAHDGEGEDQLQGRGQESAGRFRHGRSSSWLRAAQAGAGEAPRGLDRSTWGGA